MANPEHLAKLKEGVEAWNQWRRQNPKIAPDLSKAELSEARLSGMNLVTADLNRANLSGGDLRAADLRDACLRKAKLIEANIRDAILRGADLSHANLHGADLSTAGLFATNLSEANLRRASLSGADLEAANLSRADLTGAYLTGANFYRADLSGANLSSANLSGANVVRANLENANLTACRVFGISAWNVRVEGAIQSNLVITPQGESPIQVDNLEVAQFIYLLLNNQKIRSVIDTITSKVVLILGRFTPERKVILDAIRDELRKRDYLPVLLDFEKPSSRDLTETISTLAHMARFVIADITDAKSIPQELMAIVPNMPSVPVQPLLLASQQEYGMFEHFRNYPWVLEEVLYDDQQTLLAELSEKVIAPAEAKAKELARK